jgi:hypothetical protein
MNCRVILIGVVRFCLRRPPPSRIPPDISGTGATASSNGKRAPSVGSQPMRCDHCGQLGVTGQHDWPHRPFNVSPHSSWDLSKYT